MYMQFVWPELCFRNKWIWVQHCELLANHLVTNQHLSSSVASPINTIYNVASQFTTVICASILTFSKNIYLLKLSWVVERRREVAWFCRYSWFHWCYEKRPEPPKIQLDKAVFTWSVKERQVGTLIINPVLSTQKLHTDQHAGNPVDFVASIGLLNYVI